MTNPDSMVERVAQALFRLARETVTRAIARWESQDEAARDDYRKAARAAIAVMREPTDGMIEAGDRRADPFIASGDDCTETIVYEAWLGMIDEALK